MHNFSLFNGKKICFVAGTLGQGGAERQLYNMLSVLKKKGVAVHVLCLTRSEFWEEPILELGIPVTWVGQSGNRFVRLLRILKEVHSIGPDILQSAHFYTNLYVGLAGKLLGIPNIGAMRSNCFKEVNDNGRIMGLLQLKMPKVIAGNSMQGIRNAATLGISFNKLFFCQMP